MTDIIEIVVGDVTDMEAQVVARYCGDGDGGIALDGKLRGPVCEGVRTLAAEFLFRNEGGGRATAVVTDPCMWSAEMPHVYEVNVTARVGDRVVAEYRGSIGLRRLAPRRAVDFAPGTG